MTIWLYGYIPPVFGRGEKHCHHGTWLESSSKVWSSSIWRREGNWGLSSFSLSSLFAKTSSLHPPAPRDSIKVDTFFCVSDTVMAARTYWDWLAKRGEPFDVCGRDAVGEPIGGLFYLRGHPQTVVGDALTELPTKLGVERWRREKKQRRQKKRDYLTNI